MAAQDSSQSYLSKLSPWSRSPTVQPSRGKNGEPEPLLKPQKGGDHVISQRHRLSLRQYPRDCPHLRPQWFHAVDVPKRRPTPAGKIEKDEKAPAAPKKYAAFSVRDSKAIEAAYRKLAEGEEAAGRARDLGDVSSQEADSRQRTEDRTNISLDDHLKPGKMRVPVNEDYLFDVDVERRELGPAYWLGPVYDVKRGTWFYQESGSQRPCDENLASQLEDGYLKLKAWRLPSREPAQKSRSSSQPRGRPTSWTPGEDTEKLSVSVPMTPKGSNPDLRRQAVADVKPPSAPDESDPSLNEHPQNTYRLFGAHMNSVVTYQDATTAWLLTDDFMSRMNYSMYQRFAGGGHFGGIKLTRGYIREIKKADGKNDKAKDDKATTVNDVDQEDNAEHDPTAEDHPERQSPSEARRARLERHMSSLLEDPTTEDRAKQEEELRKRDEREMEEDYLATEGDEQGREIEHLILVTHGIGQRLGLRIESVNFVHDVNTLRKTIKAVYADSPDLRALNAELGSAEHVNSRVQVLPICWRHLLDFPKQSLRHNRKEQDLADTEFEDEEYPSLEDISVDGVPAVRNLITDLALDILLYQSAAYKDHISRIVLEECNRIYHLFMERNPTFKGKVSLIGHSLGSAIMFDLLCRQGLKPDSAKHHHRKDHHRLKFDFDVEDFYALGSPIGLFQMLKGRTVAARQTTDKRNRAVSTSTDDPMFDVGASSSLGKNAAMAMTGTTPGDTPVSSPKCAQIFNIFHPTDPISYRMEPLISQAMSSLKPQPLPYTKRGIFGAPMGQGLTGIGARVSQSVSSMWSSMASSLLTRGLGYTGGEPTQLANAQNANKSSVPLSLGAGTNLGAEVIPTAPPLPADGNEIAKISENAQDKVANDTVSADQIGQHPPTLIDAELETLYGGYQKRRKSVQSDSETRDLGAGPLGGSPEWLDAEERAKRLRREEEKVRRLNSNGRVDYAIQEGAFDINLIAAIASHLSYWSDEDVSHFIVSQLLSRHRIVRPRSSGSANGR